MRYLTFSFDDGLIDSARAVASVLDEDHATFFVTTGWILPNTVPIEVRYNVGRNHGTIDDWLALSRMGHDIGSHTVSHRVPEYAPEHADAVRREFDESLQFVKQIHDGPYSVSMPYHKAPPTEPKLETLYQAVRIGPGPLNTLDALNFAAVHTIDQDAALDELPDNVWAVYALHGIDEGYRPISLERFCEMVRRARERGWVIRSMKEMLIEFRCKRPTSYSHWVTQAEWSEQASSDQKRMIAYLRTADLRGRRILHVGTGNSELGLLCAATAAFVDTTSISRAEIEKANSSGRRNYHGFLCNKYMAAELLSQTAPAYDLIIDNNIAGFACCRLHFLDMMRAYLSLLAPGGWILVDEVSLSWASPWLDRREWSLSLDGLTDLGSRLGFTVRRVNETELALVPADR